MQHKLDVIPSVGLVADTCDTYRDCLFDPSRNPRYPRPGAVSEGYLAKCSSLLRADGALLIQAITIQDQLYAAALGNVDFIQRFVFPGSFIPSITAIADATARTTDMKLFHLRDIGPHYATTLRKWREAFFASIDKVRALGYPEQFIRLWDYYLCYCEGGFAERQLGDVQMLLVKRGFRG